MMDDGKALARRGPDRQTWYVVANAVDLASAEIPAGLLRSAGIPVFLIREALNSAMPMSFGPLGGVEVVVPAEHYQEALALLDADFDLPNDELPPADDDALDADDSA